MLDRARWGGQSPVSLSATPPSTQGVSFWETEVKGERTEAHPWPLRLGEGA